MRDLDQWRRAMSMTSLPVLIVLATLAAVPTRAAGAVDPDQIAAGRQVAEHSCGGCHAVGAGPSSLSDAPPFRELYLRYPREGLDRLLQEGMIAPEDPYAEGPTRYHPRMPLTHLDIGQIDSLRAYLQSLEPKARGPAVAGARQSRR